MLRIRHINVLISVGLVLALALGSAVGRPVAAALAGGTAATPPPPSFTAPPLYSLDGPGEQSVGINAMVSGDFNGDGVPDLATVPLGGAAAGVTKTTGVSVYLGKGGGAFQAPVNYPAGSYPIDVVAVRLRGKNAPLDLIALDAGQNANNQYTIAVLLGNGDGTFQAPKVTTIPFSALSMAVGDFNGDGKPDVAIGGFSGVTNNGPEELTILTGNGDGTFKPATSYVAGDGTSGYYDMAVGDVNNDGHLDVIGMDPSGLWLSLGNGDGTFEPAVEVWADPTTYLGPSTVEGPAWFALGDFNGDGNLDVALDIQGARIDVLLGTGTGAFLPLDTPSNIITGDQTGNGLGEIVAADINGDKKLDLVVATGYGATLVVLDGNGNGTFASPVIYPLAETNPSALVVTDVNNDGRPDVIVGTDGAFSGNINYLAVLLNQGNGTFLRPQQFSVVAPYDNQTANPTNPIGVALGDFNGDGKLDAVVTEWDVPIEPLTNGQLPAVPTINTANDTVDTGGSIAVLLGNGDGTFQTEKQYYVGGRPIAVATGDLTGDGKQDIVVANAFSNTLSILKGNGDGTFQSAITVPVGTNPTALVLGDFNGDGKPDIAVTNLVSNDISVLINASTPGHLSFQSPVNYAVGTYPDGVVTGDFNHDGKLDLAVLNDGYPNSPSPTPSALSVLLGKGDGTFGAAQTQTLWRSPGADAIAAGDFAGNGTPDLAVADFASDGFGPGQVMILRGNGDGSFTPAGTYTVGAGAESIVVADFNGDGRPDLAVDDINDNSVAMLLGNGDGTFALAADSSSPQPHSFGWSAFAYPTFLAVGDLTGSGKPDIVTANIFDATVTVLRNTSPLIVPIRSGWNLIDLPLQNGAIGTTAALTAALTGANQLPAGSIHAMATYASGRFSLYVPGYTAPTALHPSDGVFVLSTSAGYWMPTGTPYVKSQPIALAPGWNLAAAPYPYAGMSTDTVAQEVDRTGGRVQEIATYGDGGYRTWLPGQTAFLVRDTSGMWIETATSAIWTPQ